MFYTRATVTALQAQIEDLQKRLDESEAERKRLCTELHGAESVSYALQSQVDDLSKRLDVAEGERKDLLDRLLAKHNVEPLRESPPAPAQPVIQLLSPTNGITPEMEDAVRADWLAEEAAFIQLNSGLDEERAMRQAEQEYVRLHQVIN